MLGDDVLELLDVQRRQLRAQAGLAAVAERGERVERPRGACAAPSGGAFRGAGAGDGASPAR
ncbi:hypothetical protein ACYAFX_09500 [Rhodococcus aetherivorans]